MIHIGVLTALLGAVLAYLPGLSDPYSLPKVLVLACGTGLAWCGLALTPARGMPLRRTPLDLPLAILFAAMLASSLFSADMSESLIGRYESYFHGLLPLLLCAGLYYAASASPWKKEPIVLLNILLGAGALSAFMGILTAPLGTRILGASGSPVYLGSCLVLLCPPALHLALSQRATPRLFSATAGIVILAGLALTLSRSAYLGAAVGIAVYLILSGRWSPKKGKRSLLKIVITLLLVSAGIFAASQLRPSALSDSSRLHTWHTSIKIFFQHPLLGHGPDTYMTAYRRYRTEGAVRTLGARHGQDDAHNDILHAAATTGILGLVAYLFLLWQLFLLCREALSCKENRGLMASLAGALAGLFIQAKFNPVPLTSIALAAVYTALLLPASAHKASLPKYIPGCAAVIFLAAAGFFLRLSAADSARRDGDVAVRLGRTAHAESAYDRAMRLNPWQLRYTTAYHRLIYHALTAATPPLEEPQRKTRINRALALSRDAIRRHPYDAGAQHMMGLSLWLARKQKTSSAIEDPRASLERAQSLDPYFMPTRRLRLRIAMQEGDTDEVERVTREARELSKILPAR